MATAFFSGCARTAKLRPLKALEEETVDISGFTAVGVGRAETRRAYIGIISFIILYIGSRRSYGSRESGIINRSFLAASSNGDVHSVD